MKISELLESKLPDIVYHGTASSNLSNIMKNGLKPKLNKWFYSNKYQQSGSSGYKLKPEERMKDLADLSTTVSLERAIKYAKQGGSTGWGNVPSVVLAFKPLPSDVIEFDGFDSTEIIFKNVISPERLEIVWPEKLTGKKDALLGKAAEKKEFGSAKTLKIKEINKQLKSVGSGFSIKSTSPNTARIKLFYNSETPLISILRTGEKLPVDMPWSNLNTDIDSEEFKNFLQKELSNPFTTTDYLKFKNYLKSSFSKFVV